MILLGYRIPPHAIRLLRIRFSVTYGSGLQPDPAVEAAIAQVGRALFGKTGFTSLPRVFESLDADCDGYLDRSELLTGLRELFPEGSGPADSLLTRVVDEVDKDKNGQVSLLEFLAAFTCYDTQTRQGYHRRGRTSIVRPIVAQQSLNALGHRVEATLPQGVCDRLLQSTLAVLYNSKAQLRRCWSFFDTELEGLVGPEQFHRGLSAFSCSTGAELLTEAQINAMVANLNQTAEGLVNYEAFLDSLQVVCLD